MTGRILIADDVSTNRIILKARLSAAAYTTNVAANGRELLDVARETAPDLIVLAESTDKRGGARLCAALRETGRTRAVPVIMLCVNPDRATRLAALQAGADAVLGRMPDDRILMARIRNLLRRSASEAELGTDHGVATNQLAEAAADFSYPGQVALIATSLAEGLRWRNGLGARLRDRIAVIDPAHALSELGAARAPDAVVIAEHPDRPDDAMQLVSDLRSRSQTLRSAVVLLQQRPDAGRAVMALDLGVSDLVDDGFEPEEMSMLLRRELRRKAQNDSRRAALQDSLRLASTDPLTGLFNRRYALSQLDEIVHRAPEKGERFAVMVLDLDRFKRINDDFGHAAGDAVLAEVSQRMATCLRREDFLARIGGEEFLAVIRACSPEAAETAAERLRSVVADTPVTLPDGKGDIAITLSIGLVVGGSAGMPEDPATLIDLADRGLYVAKAGGRNQVNVHEHAA